MGLYTKLRGDDAELEGVPRITKASSLCTQELLTRCFPIGEGPAPDKCTLMDLGSGYGGTARVAAKELGCKVRAGRTGRRSIICSCTANQVTRNTRVGVMVQMSLAAWWLKTRLMLGVSLFFSTFVVRSASWCRGTPLPAWCGWRKCQLPGWSCLSCLARVTVDALSCACSLFFEVGGFML